MWAAEDTQREKEKTGSQEWVPVVLGSVWEGENAICPMETEEKRREEKCEVKACGEFSDT